MGIVGEFLYSHLVFPPQISLMIVYQVIWVLAIVKMGEVWSGSHRPCWDDVIQRIGLIHSISISKSIVILVD